MTSFLSQYQRGLWLSSVKACKSQRDKSVHGEAAVAQFLCHVQGAFIVVWWKTCTFRHSIGTTQHSTTEFFFPHVSTRKLGLSPGIRRVENNCRKKNSVVECEPARMSVKTTQHFRLIHIEYMNTCIELKLQENIFRKRNWQKFIISLFRKKFRCMNSLWRKCSLINREFRDEVLKISST